MLVLGRKPNESLLIGDDIVVTILGVEGDRVKVGIAAPGHVRILRQEIYEAVKAENLRAASPAPGAQSGETLLNNLKGLFPAKQEPS
jgi:carbon storage regulator